MTKTVRRLSGIALLPLWLAVAGISAGAQSLTSYVDPLIGSGGHGHVFVGASVPFGMVQLGPQNFFKGWDWCSGYHYGDSVLTGFAHTHLSGTGIGDLGDILIMPYTGPVKTGKGKEQVRGSGYASRYSHRREKVRPGYYSVHLDDYDILAELTATERVGFHRYHFPAGKNAHVIIDLREGLNDQATDTYIKQLDAYTLEGYRFSKGWAKDQRIFFAIRSSVPVREFEVYNDTVRLRGKEGKGRAVKGLISFDKAPAVLELKVGLSPVSSENALANIRTEIPGWDFEGVAKQADAQWNRELSRITIQTRNDSDKRVFYTALYHTMIDPAVFNDHNGDYRGTDKKVYKKAAFTNYSVFSLWDTYRAEHPLLILTQPKRVADMVNSMLAIDDQQGKLPIWHLMGNETGTMVGISSLQVIAEAYLKNIGGFDPARAYAAVRSTAMTDPLGLKYVKALQAIPQDAERRSVAKGLEYAVSDGSIALMARKMGKSGDYSYFRKRAGGYKRYFDPADGFFKGKLSGGQWMADFNPLKSNNNVYAEGDAWQYLWLVPQDVEGLVSLLGGEKRFNKRLDSFFILKPDPTEDLADLTGLIGQYAHGNEPSHHIAYLYAYTGQQWKTARTVRYIMHDFYRDDPDGIIGNEDCGQMSAWYVFSSLGFYPVFPASGVYVIGSPLFDKATLNLANGKKFTVETVHNGPQNLYITGLELNGKKYEKDFLRYEDIMKGGVLKVFMGDRPARDFGKLPGNRPPSPY
ncbi:GH92 family glycosyl hydrolase [Compostibacter hankyongensis]|uniref:GH92 family glycosyl hydrolase n=1 Tax=Compostibacter hankyongensis TaxID=1007089 RepID=A0ABP8FCW3_9BACT